MVGSEKLVVIEGGAQSGGFGTGHEGTVLQGLGTGVWKEVRKVAGVDTVSAPCEGVFALVPFGDGCMVGSEVEYVPDVKVPGLPTSRKYGGKGVGVVEESDVGAKTHVV